MKITKQQLKQIINEEFEAMLGEKFTMPPEAKDISRKPGMAPGLDAQRQAKRDALKARMDRDMRAYGICSGQHDTKAPADAFWKCMEDQLGEG